MPLTASQGGSGRTSAPVTGKFLSFFPSISQFHRDKVPAGRILAANSLCQACVIIMRSIHLFVTFLAAQIRGLQSDSRGVVALMIALALPLLAGFAALAVDTSTWSSAQNSAKGAADNAAISAAVAAGGNSNISSNQITNEVLANAALNGFTNGQNGVTVTVNNPPKSGSHTGNTSAYEVIVTQPQNLFFGKLLGAAPTIQGRTVALAGGGTPACVLALDPSASGAITMSGGASVGAPNCAVAANSSSATAANFSGGATLTAANFNVVGNYTTSGGATVSATIKTGAPATADPYASLTVPSFSGCNQTNYTLSGGGTATISQGVYCGGITVSGGSQLTMNSGTYMLVGTNPGSGGNSFYISGGSTVTGSGVSIVITATGSTAPMDTRGTVNISGGTTVTLSAPTSGPMQGVAFYMDRNAPRPLTTGCNNNQCTDNFSGGSSMSITGSLYFPSQPVNYSGGSSSSACEQLIACTVTFSGGASFGKSRGSLTVPGLQSPTGTGIPVE
jgi:Flp pilus assembly protein TadG